MKPSNAALLAAAAITTARTSFPIAHVRRAVREFCVGTEKRVSDLEAEIATLKSLIERLPAAPDKENAR